MYHLRGDPYAVLVRPAAQPKKKLKKKLYYLRRSLAPCVAVLVRPCSAAKTLSSIAFRAAIS